MSHSIDSLLIPSMILKGNDIFPGYHHRNAPYFSVSGSRSMSVVFEERLYQSFLRRRWEHYRAAGFVANPGLKMIFTCHPIMNGIQKNISNLPEKYPPAEQFTLRCRSRLPMQTLREIWSKVSEVDFRYYTHISCRYIHFPPPDNNTERNEICREGTSQRRSCHRLCRS